MTKMVPRNFIPESFIDFKNGHPAIQLAILTASEVDLARDTFKEFIACRW